MCMHVWFMMCVWVHIFHNMCVDIRKQHEGVGSLLPLRGSYKPRGCA